MRAFASGLGAAFDPAPIRILRLLPQAVGLLSAYRGDPAWSTEALLSMPKGGKTACAFVEWARELGRVHDEQSHVQDFLRRDDRVREYSTVLRFRSTSACGDFKCALREYSAQGKL